MSTIALKFFTNEAKKLTKWAVGMTKKAVKTCLRVQYNAAVLPIYFVYGGVKYVYQSYISKDEQKPPLEPRCDVIVGAMKRLRSSVVSSIDEINSRCDTISRPIANCLVNEDRADEYLFDVPDISDLPLEDGIYAGDSRTQYMGMNEFTGSDLMWDLPIISAKAKYFSECLGKGNERKLETARRALTDHPIHNVMPETREQYNLMLKNANGCTGNCVTIPVSESSDVQCRNRSNANRCTGNCVTIPVSESGDVQCRNRSNTNSGINVEAVSSVLDMNRGTSQVESSDIPSNRDSQRRLNPVITQKMVVRRELGTINRTLRKIQTTCTYILEGLSTLNKSLDKVTSMKEKLVGLELQVDEGKKLLHQVETDRYIMKAKLVALEKLINEEEQYLYDSGFFESGNNPGTSCER